MYRLLFVLLCAVFCGAQNYTDDVDYVEDCTEIGCGGPEYTCVYGMCICARGYTLHPYEQKCIKCPGSGESCYATCCSNSQHSSLQCWHGVCQRCYDRQGNWICDDHINQEMLVSVTQIAMGMALVLGILAIFMLLYRLCSTTDVRPIGRYYGSERLSVGSLQLYINRRLRDAPPRYSRTAPAAPNPESAPRNNYLNAGFIHDSSVPPPPYTAEDLKNEEPGSSVHI